MDSKSMFKSRTIWFNFIALVPVVFDAVASSTALFQPVVPAKWWPMFLAVVTVVNLVLRKFTTQPIGKPDA
jgi:hypothetical protein